ncbi:tetratricopeptide repeat protein [Thalassotalea piscium]|uniref:Sel1 repeat family protein n=1 Tax=Thalassotalea piscium TaxID=1230533 RepID=A0A7X0NFA4_9GAMM|nr:tetratricopeptide repeat protein [Thalassotalea piscium]MBB6542365.1 hypothetical protein [Thalassotalea piscium]
MTFNEALNIKSFKVPKIKPSYIQSIVAIVLLLILLLIVLYQYKTTKAEQNQSLAVISNPKINDIYFVDYRLLSDKLRPTEKYRIAKVVDITGDIVTLVYSALLYQRQNAAINSISYGQLRYSDSFETKRYNLPLSEIKNMYYNNVIYLAKRPVRKKLFGNLVGPEKPRAVSSHLIYGKKENITGESYLNERFSETNLASAFEYFQQSAELGYAQGQVNLAEMYINGRYVEIDFKKALFWLEQASLQSYKPAILKYGIICKQVSTCNLADFYHGLTNFGVNIKVRKLDFTLDK